MSTLYLPSVSMTACHDSETLMVPSAYISVEFFCCFVSKATKNVLSGKNERSHSFPKRELWGPYKTCHPRMSNAFWIGLNISSPYSTGFLFIWNPVELIPWCENFSHWEILQQYLILRCCSPKLLQRSLGKWSLDFRYLLIKSVHGNKRSASTELTGMINTMIANVVNWLISLLSNDFNYGGPKINNDTLPPLVLFFFLSLNTFSGCYCPCSLIDNAFSTHCSPSCSFTCRIRDEVTSCLGC